MTVHSNSGFVVKKYMLFPCTTHFSLIFFGVSTECCIFANNNAAFDAA